MSAITSIRDVTTRAHQGFPCPFTNFFHDLGQNRRWSFQVSKILQLLLKPVFVSIAHFVSSFFKVSRPRYISDFTLASDTLKFRGDLLVAHLLKME